MASLNTLKTTADSYLAQWWPAFTAWQESYRNDPVRSPDGHYWQGVLWPQAIPDDGVAVQPPNSESDYYPPYQSYPLPWRVVAQEVVAAIVSPLPYWSAIKSALAINTPPNLVVSIRCDQYGDATDGTGYYFTVAFTKNGVRWAKTLGVGAATTLFAHDWKDETPGPVS